MGKQLYIERITYTGHGTTEGKYSVHFTRDRELGEPKRVDVQISDAILNPPNIDFSNTNN